MRSLSPTTAKAGCANTAYVKAACVAALAAAGLVLCTQVRAMEEPAHPAALDDAIIAAAKRHGVPEHLVRRIIMRESKYNPRARNRRYWGLMQISYPTARSMGFKGTPQELLNPVVNLRYAVPYLANAFVCAGKREDAAVRLYAAGYYFTARTRGLLSALRTAESTPLNGIADEATIQPTLAANASAQPAESIGVFGALFNPGQQPAPQPQAATYSADASATAQPQPRPATAESTEAPAGTFKGKAVAMEADKNGDLAPPKKWKRDGGTSVIARGEQPIQRVAANDEDSGRKSRRHARKITLVATLDEPPATAQAYAAAPGQDPRFAAAPSQAAISQATAPAVATQQVDAFGQPVATPQVDAFGRPIAPPQVDAYGRPLAAPQSQPANAANGASVQAKADDDEKPAKRKRSRHAKKRKSHDETQVAECKEPPAPTPELRQTQTQ